MLSLKNKFFVVSDIHSYFTIFKNALDKAGYDENNPTHYLIVCGDCFDRGDESQQVLDFLKDRERCILIKGNHEDLILDCLRRKCFLYYDYHNGTNKTVEQIGDKVEDFISGMVDYFETKHYIFVHSWLPMKNWKDAPEFKWKDARWRNPFETARMEENITGKTIVFGHWHTSAFHSRGREFDENACFDIAYDKEHNVIGIDGCIAYSKQCNILIIEDEMAE